MARRWLRMVVPGGLMLGVIIMVRRTMSLRRELASVVPSSDQWAPIPGPPEAPWVAPGDSGCPASHPIKAKASSGIFHLPGMLAYDRTRADRCYQSEAAAQADGFTKAKR